MSGGGAGGRGPRPTTSRLRHGALTLGVRALGPPVAARAVPSVRERHPSAQERERRPDNGVLTVLCSKKLN
jgi:hypothetical protein